MILRKTELFEILLIVDTRVYKLPDVKNLQGKRITGLAVFPPGTRSKEGKVLASPDDMYLKLQNAQNDAFLEIPLLAVKFNPGAPRLLFFETDLEPINMPKCELKIADNATFTAGTSVQFMIAYED